MILSQIITKNFPVLHRNMAIGSLATHMNVAARQVDLEPSVAGVDRARTYEFWLRYSGTSPSVQGRVVNIAENTGNTNQLIINLIPQDNNTGVGQRLRCQLLTNATNLIYIQSQNVLPKNQWIHVIWTYTGSEANTGFELFLNGVKETSPTRNLTGTYTGALNSANLRFKVSNHDTANAFVGALKRLRVWDKALSDSEAAEVYNGGFPSVTADMSFAANLVAEWPFETNADCSNNASFNFSVTGSPTYVTSEIIPGSKRVNFRRSQEINTRYVAFPSVIRKDSNTASVFVRSGTSHIVNGKITRTDINLTTGVASAPVDVITDGTWDLRNGSSCIDDVGNIHVFSSRYNGGTDTFIDTGKYKSTDGGTTFGAIETFATTETRFNFYGKCVNGFASGEFFVPFFEHDGTNFLISVFKTTDNWDTHSKITVYSGTSQYTEPALVNLGNDTLLMLSRRNNSPYGIFQIVSTDGGDTWSVPTLTNLASTTGESNAAVLLGKNGKITAIITDRGDNGMTRSLDNLPSTILASATAWNTPSIFFSAYATDTSYDPLGYPEGIVLDDGRILSVFSSEFSSSRADMFYGIGSF